MITEERAQRVCQPWDLECKRPYCHRHPGGKTVEELNPAVGDRFRLTPHEGNCFWTVERVVERGIVVGLRSESSHLTLWEKDMVLYPV